MIEKPKNVRPIAIGDEQKLFDLLCLAYKENAPYTMSENKVRHMIAEGASDKCTVIGVIDSPDGKSIAGSIGGYFAQWWYTDDWHIEECWNFVHPEHRKLPLDSYKSNGERAPVSYAQSLISYMKWVSDKMAIPLHMGIMTSARFAAKERLYRRQMPQVGSAFAYNLNMANGPIADEVSI